MVVNKIHINVSYGDHPGLKVGGIYTYNLNECKALSQILGKENVINWVGYDEGMNLKEIELWREGEAKGNEEDLKTLKDAGLNITSGRWKKTDTPVFIVDGLEWADKLVEVPNKGLKQRKHWIMQLYNELYGTNTFNASKNEVENALAKGMMCTAALYGLNGLPKEELLHCHEHLSASSLLLMKSLRDHNKEIQENYGGIENLVGFVSRYPTEGRFMSTTHATHLFRCFVNDPRYQENNIYGLFPKLLQAGIISQMYLAGDNNRDNVAKHTLECALLKEADVAYTVSPMVQNECKQLHNIVPKLVFNGLDIDFNINSLTLDSTSKDFKSDEFKAKLKKLREETTMQLFDKMKTYFRLPDATYDNTYIILTSGRDDVSKGIPDLYVNVFDKLNRWLIDDHRNKHAIDLPLIMTWNIKDEKGEDVFNPEYIDYTVRGKIPDKVPYFVRLPAANPHPFLDKIWRHGLANEDRARVRTLVRNEKIEDYLKVVNGATLALFTVRYGPFEYAPLETIAQGIPTVTTNIIGLVQALNHRRVPYIDYHDRESIEWHEDSGIFVTGTDASNIAHCIYDIINKYTPAQLVDKGISSYAYASRFNSSRMARDIMDAINGKA